MTASTIPSRNSSRCIVYFLVAFCSYANGFSTSLVVRATSPRTSACDSLNLVPDQGSQLVAAWAANHFDNDDDSDDDTITSNATEASGENIAVVDDNDLATPAPTAGARALVSRLFTLPSAIKKKIEGLERNNDDVVYYPVVGFQFVKDAPDHISVLSTTSHPSCPLHYQDVQNEEFYGWYSAACILDTSEEEEQYCSKPVAVVESDEEQEPQQVAIP